MINYNYTKWDQNYDSSFELMRLQNKYKFLIYDANVTMIYMSFTEFTSEYFIFNTFMKTLYKKGRWIIIDSCHLDVIALPILSITSYNLIIRNSDIKSYLEVFYNFQVECDFKDLDDVMRIMDNNTIHG